MESKSKLQGFRYPKSEQKIQREKITTPIREESEILSAYEQMGDKRFSNPKSWYRDIYEFYQNNEC